MSEWSLGWEKEVTKKLPSIEVMLLACYKTNCFTNRSKKVKKKKKVLQLIFLFLFQYSKLGQKVNGNIFANLIVHFLQQTSSSPLLKRNAWRIRESAKISSRLLCMGEAFVSLHLWNQYRHSLCSSSNTGCKWLCFWGKVWNLCISCQLWLSILERIHGIFCCMHTVYTENSLTSECILK